jgi:hypothetical protein
MASDQPVRGRIAQARNRADGVMRHRMARLAEMVSREVPIRQAGERMGLTPGQSARVWMNIKDELGRQAQ